jgi:hypothetical protein
LTNTSQKKSTLEGFFDLVNKEKEELRKNPNFDAKSLELRYVEIPTEYTWNGKIGEFHRKGREVSRIGRLYFVNPSDQETYYLR